MGTQSPRRIGAVDNRTKTVTLGVGGFGHVGPPLCTIAQEWANQRLRRRTRVVRDVTTLEPTTE